jgi:hypothetical protein
MRLKFLVIVLASLLTGCAQTALNRKPRPGTVYVDKSGSLIEVGLDGKAHKTELPLDRLPIGFGGS